jgi:nucleotide-binding universal stress UspA family protein
MTPSTIVAGVDGTEPSADALALGDLLADPLEAQVLAVHSHPYGRLESFLGDGEYERLVREVAESTYTQLKSHVRDEKAREIRLVSAPSPAAGLIKVADEVSASLIVVGPSQRSGVGRIRPGSVGERVLSGAPSPVAIAPRGYAETSPSLSTIGCAFDGSPDSRLAVEWAGQLAEASGTQLVVISVHSPMSFGGHLPVGATSPESVDQALRRELKSEHEDLAASLAGGAQSRFVDGDPASELLDFSEDLDLLVMGSRGYGPVRATLLGSVSQKVIRDASAPVVICPRGLRGSDGDDGTVGAT